MKTEEIVKLYVACSEPIEVGQTLDGFLRVIPIIGDTFEEKINGKVISGGTDWNIQKNESMAHVSAKYVIRTEEGDFISILNEGMIDAREQDNMKTTPRFQVSQDSQYEWLNYGSYTGKLTSGRREGKVIITGYKIMEEMKEGDEN